MNAQAKKFDCILTFAVTKKKIKNTMWQISQFSSGDLPMDPYSNSKCDVRSFPVHAQTFKSNLLDYLRLAVNLITFKPD